MDQIWAEAIVKYKEGEELFLKGNVAKEANEAQKQSMEIWCECFLNERQNIRRSDSYNIEGILTRIGGWVKYNTNKTGKTNFRLYGIQKTFIKE